MQDMQAVIQSKLFTGIDAPDVATIFSCLGARTVSIRKGEYILRAGDAAKHIGVVQSGTLQIIKEDIDGEQSLLAQLEPGDYFAEAFCCAGIKECPVNVVAETNAQVVRLDFHKIMHICPNTCTFHAKLIENMLRVVALKTIHLQERMDYMSKKTIRKKVLSYLASYSERTSKPFSIPFNREELAEYLCIDRSALSRELARLKEEKKIDYWKNQFRIL